MIGKSHLADAIMRHERHLAEFYTLLADYFPDQGKIFSRLAIEESVHLQHLRFLLNALAEGRLLLKPTALQVTIIEESISYIKSCSEALAKGDMDIVDALVIARDLEGAMIEKRYFQIFDTRNSEFRAMAETLYEDTLRHRESLQAELARRRT